MFSNYLKIAWRNLVRNKVYSAINIGGLAVGMAVAMLIGLWVYDELTFNTYHNRYERIAQVMQHQTVDGQISTNYSIPLPLEAELRSQYGKNSPIKRIVLASWIYGHGLDMGDQKFVRKGGFMQPDAPEMLSLRMLKGTRQGLRDPGSILLAESVAKAYFGDTDPMGKILKLDNKMAVRVTGVYQDLPYNTTFRDLTFIAPWELLLNNDESVRRASQQWDNNSFQLFVQLADKADLSAVSRLLKNTKLDHVDKRIALTKPEIFLEPMGRWHLYSDWKNGVNVGGRIQYVWLFGTIGLFVLLLACINFMNLSTAQSERRAKEVGIRKAVGSLRGQLIGQFFSESLLVVAIAFVLAMIGAMVSLPFFNDVADKQTAIPWSNTGYWAVILLFCLLTGLVAGSYPALYLSAVNPLRVLKGTVKAGRFASLPRRVLVVTQFTVSVTLIIGTITVFRQIQFAKDRPVGYVRAGLVTLGIGGSVIHDHYDAIQNELRNAGIISNMAESRSPMTALWQTQNGFDWNGNVTNAQAEFGTIFVTHDFGKTVGWQVKAGRDFIRNYPADSTGMVLNEAAVRYMGLTSPVGKTVRWESINWKVVGVVKDLIMESPYAPARPSIYMIGNGPGNNLLLRINPNQTSSDAVSQLGTILKKYDPTLVPDAQFVDQEYAQKFSDEERIGKLASIFAVLAIFISCLGIFGLASFMAEQRTKEIGVRKVLGASVLNLWGLLSKDFVVLVLIAFLIATPLAYYFLSNWLQQYDYRTDISWWIFAVSGVGALAITLLTVSFQSIKAALMNPVKSLRSE